MTRRIAIAVTDEARAPIMEHLEELRRRLIKMAAAVGLASVVAFLFRDWIFAFLAAPYQNVLGDQGLVFTRVTEAFSVAMRVSLFGGVLLASPVWLYQIWAFISPGLTPRERRWALPLVGVLASLFLAGVAFAYWSLNRALDFLLEFGGPTLTPLITVNDYLSFVTRFLLVFGIAFEFPVFLFAATLVGVVHPDQLARGRRWAVLAIVTIGAVVTPSGDPLTLTVLSAPLYVLYEITIWLSRLAVRRR